MLQVLMALLVLATCVFVVWAGVAILRVPPASPEERERVMAQDAQRAEAARRGRNRAHSLGRRGDPNDIAWWDRL